ncbi:hypothetical protein Tco_0484474 [Tanacetum coccineum]
MLLMKMWMSNRFRTYPLNVDNVFQADDCDAYDSDVDEAPTAQTMFMANLSSADPVYDEAGPSYDSDILSEVQDHDHFQDAICEHHEEHGMQDDVQPSYVVDSHADYTSDSNMTPYDQYVKDNAVPVVQNNASTVPNDMFELTEREQKIDEQLRIVICDRNIKEENLKKELHSVKLQLASTIKHNKLMVDEVTYLEEFLDLKALKDKVAIGYKNPLCLHRARQVQPALYSGHVIVTPNHAPAVVRDGEETLELTEISRKKMHEKMKANECVDNKMKAEALKEQNTRPIKALTVYPLNTPATLVPRVLPTKSQVKINIFTLRQLFSEFEKTCKKRITPTGITEGERGFEQTKTCYLTEVIPFFKTLQEHFEGIQKALTKEVKEMSDAFDELEAELDQSIVDRKHDEIERKNLLIEHDNIIADGLSKEVFYVASNSELNVSRFTEMQKAHNVVKARCLELEAELSNLRDNIHKDNYNELLNRFSNLEVNHLNLQLKYQNLKESFQNKPSSPVNDTPDFNSVFVIGQMKASLQRKDNVIQKLKMQISHLKETRSELDLTLDFRALDFQISQLTEKVNVLQEQNELFRAENAKIKQHYKELYDSIKITHAKHLEQITALKNENESLKYAIDVEPISPRNRNNREVHLVYLKHLKESVDTLRKIVEEAKVERPLGRSLASACHYTKHSQELLEYVFGTCPKVFNQQDKKHAHTPRKKQVTFEDQIATSSSTTYKHVEPIHTQQSNVPVPPSIGVNSCTDASGSQPMSILKKHKIPPAKSDSMKKVEEHPRTIRSSLKTMNRVDSSISSKRTLDSGIHFGAIMGYGDYVVGDSVISRVYYMEGLGHNLFSVGQFCDSDLEAAFRKHSCYVCDMDGVELLKAYEALQDSIRRDECEDFDVDKAQEETKKKSKQDSPKTPPGSPPSPPPPPLPPSGASGASGTTEASDSAQAPPPPPPSSSTHQGDRPATPEPAWTIPSSDLPVPTNNWASALKTTYVPPPENSLLAQTGDIATFMDCSSPVPEEECQHNKLSPNKMRCNSKVQYLEYLRYGHKIGRPALSISKMKAAFYPDVGLEQLVPDQFWIEEECKYDIAAMYGISHWWFQRQRFYIDRFSSEGDRRAVRTHMRILSVVRIEVFSMYGYDYMKKIILRRADLKEYVIVERDFKYMYPSDFEDLYLLNLQEDFQLGIESYQTQLNLTKPRWDATGFEFKHDYTVIDSLRASQQDKSRDEYKILDEERRCQKQGVHVRYPETAKDTTYLPESGELIGGRFEKGDYRLQKITNEGTHNEDGNPSRANIKQDLGKYGDSDGYTFDDPILILEILSRRFLLREIYLITGSSKDGDGDTSFQ